MRDDDNGSLEEDARSGHITETDVGRRLLEFLIRSEVETLEQPHVLLHIDGEFGTVVVQGPYPDGVAALAAADRAQACPAVPESWDGSPSVRVVVAPVVSDPAR